MRQSTLAQEHFVGNLLFTEADQSVDEDIQSQLICCPKIKPAACHKHVYYLKTFKVSMFRQEQGHKQHCAFLLPLCASLNTTQS